MNVAVIGSGLAAIGTIRALIKQGIKPIVLDWGDVLDQKRSELIDNMSQKSPKEWSDEERSALSKNSTLNDGTGIPKKLIFGSGYFYGKSRKDAPVVSSGNPPPYSYAAGGFSVGWGAAVLPPQDCDLHDWPFDANEINQYIEKLLLELPYSAKDDGLSLNFPLLSSNPSPLDLSAHDTTFLENLQRKNQCLKDDLVYGQARLLVHSSQSGKTNGCRSCGECMSGCVYKSIYKTNDEIRTLHDEGKIVYNSRVLVTGLSEVDNEVIVTSIDESGVVNTALFDRVFLAAGAVNSTRIVMASLDITDRKVSLKTRGGFVLPVFSFKKIKSNWPNCNTQPGLFIELKGQSLPHWVHIQVSSANELMRQKLKLGLNDKGILSMLKRFIVNHVVLTMVNYHSDHSGTYDLWMTKSEGADVEKTLHTSHKKMFPQLSILWFSCTKIMSLFLKAGGLPLFPLAKLNSGSYHVGGSMPMAMAPSNDLETDTLGRVPAWDRIHIVDSSVFPSLPGTTIGLLAMANAYRIVEQLQNDNLGESCDSV